MPELSVVICSLNGAPGVDRCLRAVAAQTAVDRTEVIVVDDGSSDDTAAVAAGHGVRVFRHEVNRGLAMARNTGVEMSTAPIVAFLDDDCEPRPDWSERILAAFAEPDVIGAGGPVVSAGGEDYVTRFLERHNPFDPLEVDLARSERVAYRFWLYLRRQWAVGSPGGRRPVLSILGANMAFRRTDLVAAGAFDDRFTFGSEELDLCLRLARRHGAGCLVFDPEAQVLHHFHSTLGAVLRRSVAYGRGAARLYRKWPSMRPTFFPFPLLLVAVLVRARRQPLAAALAALLAPQLMFPAALRRVIATGELEALADPYLQLAQEAADDVGFVRGLWVFRHFPPNPDAGAGFHEQTGAPAAEVLHVAG